MTDQIKSVAATHPIRQAAFRYADKMRESEDFMADIDSNLIAIETAKHSSLTMLWDIRQIFTPEELDAFPAIGSEEPKARKDTNTLYDWYQASDGSDQRFYYDLFDALKPDIVSMRKAVREYAKKGSNANDKDALAKQIIGENAKEYEAAFRALAHGSEDLERAARKWDRRFTSGRDMILKAFATVQIVKRLNTDTTSCHIVEVKDKDGKAIGYDRSPNPILFDNDYDGRAKAGVPYQRSIWSVGTLMQLVRQEKTAEGKPIVINGQPWTKLDQAFEEGGGYDRIAKILNRGKQEGGAETKADMIKKLSAETPEQVNTVVNSLAGFFYDVDESGNWKLKEKAEGRLLEALKAKDQDEAVIALCKLQEALDSIAVKLNPRYSRIQQEAHNAVKPAA